ncbi:MAG: WGR domain-containing protein [Deltaproteobacteria bacterium]|nr:WGR domain-containing protein [Deltaproteobacteria bacterium]
MAEWNVSLEFEEGSSSKFWRARVEGSRLFVNYGRIGTDGQTQIKDFPNEAGAKKEIDKLEREKRKKGYADAGSGGGGDEDEPEDSDEEEEEEEEEKKPKAAPKKSPPAAAAFAAAAIKRAPEHADFAYEGDGRSIEVRVTLDGVSVRTTIVEKFGSAADAKEGFEAARNGMSENGYTKVPTRDTFP